MDPVTLLAIGPTLLRGVGALLGGRTQKVAETVATVADQVSGLSPAAARSRLGAALSGLPAEDLLALKEIEAKFAEIEKEREAARLAAETAQHAASQETARIEAQSDDEYVRRTRPMLARYSAYVTFLYAAITGVVFPALNVAHDLALPGTQEWIVVALFGPCLSYIGARTIDSFSRGGKT
jgi:hypothetical protein